MAIQRLQFPLPDVESALAPYIHTREETARIRRIINHSLFTNSTDTHESLNRITLIHGPASQTDDGSPAARSVAQLATHPGDYSGVRGAYIRALNANRAAREKYDCLRAEVESLVQSPNAEHNARRRNTSRNEDSDRAVKDSITAIRTRQTNAKLDAIESALGAIETRHAASAGVGTRAGIGSGAGSGVESSSDLASTLKAHNARLPRLVPELERTGAGGGDGQANVTAEAEIWALKLSLIHI